MTDQDVGLVLAGGGALGAYEAGALSVLLPELERQGHMPRLLIGSSVGAINATYLAAAAHLDADTVVQELVRHWKQVALDRVIRPLVLRQMPLLVARSIGALLPLPMMRMTSLLDPHPLAGTLQQWINWSDLRRNLDQDRVSALAVLGTAVWTGRAVVFCDSHTAVPRHRSHVLDYVHCPVTLEHVLASAAIPLLFPPVYVEHPVASRGWYIDGGTRLNTPLKPALDLGAQRVVVVSTSSIAEPADEPGIHDSGAPSIGDSAINLLHGGLVDPLIEDLRMLGNINTFFAEGAPGAYRYRQARGKPTYHQVPYVFVGPRRNAIGELAVETFRSRYGGFKSLRSPDFALLSRLLGAGRGELFSYMFFDHEFLEGLIGMGAADARRWLDRTSHTVAGGIWRLDPLESFVDSPGEPEH